MTAPLATSTAEKGAARDSPATSRSAIYGAAIAAFFLVYVLVYPLIPIALKTSGLGQQLPDWIKTGFEISAAPLIVAHKKVPLYRSYVEFLSAVVQAR